MSGVSSTTSRKSRSMAERDLQAAIIEAAKYLGWRIMHTRPGRTAHGWTTPIQGHAGFPDLVLLRPPRLVFAELKTAKGELTIEQSLWFNGLKACVKAEVYLWKPRDWESGAIEAVLR